VPKPRHVQLSRVAARYKYAEKKQSCPVGCRSIISKG
jgi:hypothetical protein